MPRHSRGEPLGEQVCHGSPLGAAPPWRRVERMDHGHRFTIDAQGQAHRRADMVPLEQLNPRGVGGEISGAGKQGAVPIPNQWHRFSLPVRDHFGRVAGIDCEWRPLIAADRGDNLAAAAAHYRPIETGERNQLAHRLLRHLGRIAAG